MTKEITYRMADGATIPESELSALFEKRRNNGQVIDNKYKPPTQTRNMIKCPHCSYKNMHVETPRIFCKKCKKSFSNYKTRCKACNEWFTPTHGTQFWCASCQKKKVSSRP